MKYDYDLFTIGAGSGGVRASRMAAAKGKRVGVAEERFLGGTCVNVGCVPKKLMVYAAAYSAHVEDAGGFGWQVEKPILDWGVLKANRDAEIKRLEGIYGRLLHGAGCTIFRGRATVVDEHTVEVNVDGETSRHTAEHILVATGGTATRPSEPGSEHGLISDDVFTMQTQPERLVVVGGGYIALEMASIFHGLGTKVTLVYRGPRPLRGFDDDARGFVCKELEKSGIDLHLSTTVECLEPTEGGAIDVVLSHEEVVTADAVLYAIGRTPNTRGLGLEAVGVELDERGAIVVDPKYQTSVPSIHALGDVTDRMNLTPVALAEGMALVDTLFGDGTRVVSYDNVPTAVFSLPPLATVGLTEAQARSARGEVHVYSSEFRPMKHTLSGRDERMFMKLVVDPETDEVLGVHIVGDDAAEIIQGFAVALQCGAKKSDFDRTIGLHPSAAEELVTMRTRRPDRTS